jgi:hypothetical protein
MLCYIIIHNINCMIYIRWGVATNQDVRITQLGWHIVLVTTDSDAAPSLV